MLILGHYAHIVEEIGVDGREEMPRLLRDMSFYGDIWIPLVNVFGSLMLCYGPAVLRCQARFHDAGLAIVGGACWRQLGLVLPCPAADAHHAAAVRPIFGRIGSSA